MTGLLNTLNTALTLLGVHKSAPKYGLNRVVFNAPPLLTLGGTTRVPRHTMAGANVRGGADAVLAVLLYCKDTFCATATA